MNLKTNLAHRSNYGSSRSTSNIKYIVVHYTANDGDTDENNAKYFKLNIIKTSSHYFVDSDSITQSVPDNYVAYHCGALSYKHKTCRNANSIGVELCDDKKNGTIYPSEKTIANAIELVDHLMEKYNIPKENVIRHYDVCNKLCPAYWSGTLAKDAKWKTEFWNKLGAKSTTATNNTSAATTTPAVTKVQYKSYKNGYLYEIPFSEIERVEYCQMSGTKGETVMSAAKRIKWNGRAPDIITNAELFNMNTYAASSGVVDNGKKICLPDTHGIAFKDCKTPIFSYKNNVNASDYVGGYPTLVRNGKIAFTTAPAGLDGNRARTAIGVGDNKFGVLVIPEQSGTKDATLNELANIFIQNGYKDAINLDGGGSTAYQTNEFSYEQNRKVRGFICVWYKGGKGNKAAQSSSGYQVKITASALNVRKGPSILYKVVSSLKKGNVVEISETQNGWGKLSSGAGWIKLSYTTRL